MEDLQTEIIIQIACRIKGIGQSTAGHLASDFEGNLNDFLDADYPRFQTIKKSNGNELLREEQINGLINFNKSLPKEKDPIVVKIFLISIEFLETQFETLSLMNLDSLDINPFIVKALDFTKPKQIIEFNCFQSITRSVVTSWGMTVEKILEASGAEHFKETKFGSLQGDKPDIIKTVGDLKYYIQVKSGPNTMNISMVNSLNDVIDKISQIEPKSRTLLGMTYGRKDRVSSQIQGTLRDYDRNSLIGKEFWDLIGEKEGYHKEILKILDESSKVITSESYIDLVYEKINSITEEWENRYSDKSIDEAMEDYV
jgi:hypothetical protein